MASFSKEFPYAYHVLPLHAYKLIVSSGMLLSKENLRNDGVPMRRSTTSEADAALGLSRFIHFYLPKGDLQRDNPRSFDDLSILNTQLKESATPPFPHIAIKISTGDLTDFECSVCNFNAAVSRPKYGDVKGGNHSRGISSQNLLKHWIGFKADTPDAERLRYSYWHDGIAVPLLRGNQITSDPTKVGYGTKKVCELLLEGPFKIPQSSKLYVFSNADSASLGLLQRNIAVHPSTFRWYGEQDRVEPSLRKIINEYFRAADGQLPELDYDRLRAKLG